MAAEGWVGWVVGSGAAATAAEYCVEGLAEATAAGWAAAMAAAKSQMPRRSGRGRGMYKHALVARKYLLSARSDPCSRLSIRRERRRRKDDSREQARPGVAILRRRDQLAGAI